MKKGVMSYVFIDMKSLEAVKTKLTRFFKTRIDRSTAHPLGVFLHGADVVLAFRNTAVPGKQVLAKSRDAFDFEALDTVDEELLAVAKSATLPHEHHYTVPGMRHQKKLIRYGGNRKIEIAFSEDGKTWTAAAKPVLSDASPLLAGGVFNMATGIMLLYFKTSVEKGVVFHEAHIAYFDKSNPGTVLWKTPSPVWRQKEHWGNAPARFLGAVMHGKRLLTYWFVDGKIIYAVVHTGFRYDPLALRNLALKKHEANPIIAPKAENDWEAFNTFNPAAVQAGGKVHILYRAQGFDYVSQVGYAVSKDGIHVDRRLDEPVYGPRNEFETNPKDGARHDFMSGGGFGGVEDPRVTLIGHKLYMTYVAFDGWSPPRLALTSIELDDFLNERWLWSKPVLVSRPGIVDKSGCLLPEKVNGKYVFFHRVFPNILIDYLDDLDFDGKTKWLKGEHQIKIRPDKWDSRKIGAGAPPVKTPDGWLLIYYGVDDRDASKYHIGAMLLDLADPTKVLHRSNSPILRPTEVYENVGFKPGIAYPCGAVIIKGKLLVYYGGADSVVCVATADLDTFLADLKTKEEGHLTPLQVTEVTY